MMAADAALAGRVEEIVGQATDQAAEIGDALVAIAGFLATRASLRRALTDAGRSPDSREALARQLFGQVDDAALEVLAAAVRTRWASTVELLDAVTEYGIQAHLVAAESRDRLEAVQDEVFRFGQIVRSEPDLRSALLNEAAPAEIRRELIHTLVEGKAEAESVRLVEYAVLERRGRSLEEELDRIIELAAARRRRRVAIARTAVPLTAAHRDRLQRALSEQAGVPVQLNVVVEPGLVGGVRVEIGDEVVDGSVVGRLDEARRRLAAGRTA